jgi:hypothetical protein
MLAAVMVGFLEDGLLLLKDRRFSAEGLPPGNRGVF